MKPKPIPAAGISGEALREAASSEFGAVTELVVAALRRHYGLGVNDFGIWPHSIYPDRVIVRRDGKLIQFPYTLGDDNEVTLGAAVEVVLETKPVAAAASAMREAAATEIGAIIALAERAVREKASRLFPDRYCSVSTIYTDRVIVNRDGRFYAYPYAIGDDNAVSVGEPTEVVMDHKPVASAMREAADDGWFVEAVKDDAQEDAPARYLVRVIRSGVSLNNVHYPAKVLREAAALFEGARVFAKSDEQHIKGGGKDFRQLVGCLSQARFVETTKGEGEIQAVMDVLESSEVAPRLREAVSRGMTSLFGLSIDADGTSKPNGKFREATKLTRVASVDLIIEPGAGGQVIRFAEAHQEPDMLRQKLIAAIALVNATKAAALENSSEEDVLTAYREAVATQGPPATGTDDGLTLDDVQAQIRLVEARADARARVNATKLPQAAKDRLVQRFAEAKALEDLSTAKVDEAIGAEVAYGKSFRESAPVSGLGFDAVPGESRADKIGKMLDGFFAGTGPIRSFREAYVEITGDSGVTGDFRNVDLGRLAEAAGTFREAVSAATFSALLGDSITRRMQELYTANPLYSDWRDLVDVVPVRDFRTQERGRIGGYGNLPAVAENGAYNALTSPADYKATYAISKRGGIETVSIEAIANDDVGAIRAIPQLLATAAARTLYEFILSFLDANPLIYDGLALFVAGHNNLGAVALDNTGFAAARLRMTRQTELTSNKRLGLIARHLYVPGDLEEQAFNMFVRGTNLDETFTQSRKPKVHVVPHWTDANNWFLTADKSQISLIELGFFNGQEEPELFVQDNPTQGSLFTNDQIKYKIRHIYGGAVKDYRGFDGSIVA